MQPAGLGTWKTEYDAAGNAKAYIDPLGQTTRVSWNAFGQQTGVVDPVGGTYVFEYDTLGRVISLTNAKGERALLRYDARNRVSEQIGFDGRRQQYQYNSGGELAEQIDHGRDGQLRTTLLYDALGQVIQRRLSDGTRSSFVYDSRGLLTQVHHKPAIGEPSQITYEYDAAGRRTAEVQSHHGRVWRLQHRLDPSGNRSETLLPSIGTLTWQRYGSGHIHGMLLNGEPLASFERDALHRTTQVIQGPVAQLFQFNEAGLTVAQHLLDLDEHGRSHTEPRPWRSWQYDAAGQLTHVSDAWRGERHYHYDPLTRLTGVTCQSGDTQRAAISESYRYDPAGNLLEQTRADGTQVAVEDSASLPQQSVIALPGSSLPMGSLDRSSTFPMMDTGIVLNGRHETCGKRWKLRPRPDCLANCCLAAMILFQSRQQTPRQHVTVTTALTNSSASSMLMAVKPSIATMRSVAV